MKLLKPLILIGTATLAACATTTTEVKNTAGRKTMYEDVRSQGSVAGVGIESQDITGMADKMIRDMLANPTLAGVSPAPRVIVDSEYFTNESSQRIDKNHIVDALAVELERAANGRMVFVAREFADVVEAERDLKRSGKTDAGTIRKTKATAGADYRLVGRITAMDAVDGSGMTSRHLRMTFRMLDLEYGTSVWTNSYEYKKSGQDDVIYR